MASELRFVKPKWKFKDGPFLEDVYLYAIEFPDSGVPSIINDWYVKREDNKGYYPPKRTVRPNRKFRPKSVKVTEHYFYVSLNRLTNRDEEIRKLTKEKCGGVRVKVKELKEQTIELPMDFFNRMPLGTSADIPKDQFTWSTGEKKKQFGWTRWHKFHIPTRYGGFLYINLSSGKGILFYKDYKSRAENAMGKPYMAVIASKSKKGIFRIPKDKHGTYYLKIEKSNHYKVSIKFAEVGYARKKDDTPHIPWTFWYWPEITEKDFREIKKILHKYAKAFGPSAEKPFKPKEVIKWERGNEIDLGHYRPGAEEWSGHCHNAAPASIYFERPKRSTSYNGKEFTRSEMEFLAIEWTGNYKQSYTIWDLGNMDYKNMYFFIVNMLEGMMGKWPYLYFFKPSERITSQNIRQKLIKAVAECMRIDASQRSKVLDAIKNMADDAIKEKGGEEGFVKFIKKEFGLAAERLHKCFQKDLNEKGKIMVANLRSDDKDTGPVDVWNHAVFMYRAWMVEVFDKDDDKYMKIVNRVVSNLDDDGYINVWPASFRGKGRVKENKGNAEIRILHYVLRFTDEGEILEKDPGNRWEEVTSGRSRKEKLYAPSKFFEFDKPSRTRNKGKDFGLGNPYMNWDLVDKGVLKLIEFNGR